MIIPTLIELGVIYSLQEKSNVKFLGPDHQWTSCSVGTMGVLPQPYDYPLIKLPTLDKEDNSS